VAGREAGRNVVPGAANHTRTLKGTQTQVQNRTPGTSTSFVDSPTNETVLQIACDSTGAHFLAFCLYDAEGALVAETSGLEPIPDSVAIRCWRGELLLQIPNIATEPIRYRLYNRDGQLLTTSDGLKTKLYPLLRMESVRRDWAPPAPNGQ